MKIEIKGGLKCKKVRALIDMFYEDKRIEINGDNYIIHRYHTSDYGYSDRDDYVIFDLIEENEDENNSSRV